MIDIGRHLAVGFQRFQDPASGRWFQVVNRPRATNDFHGLGAFPIMNEQLTRVP